MTSLFILSCLLVLTSVIATPTNVRADAEDDVTPSKYRLPQNYEIKNYKLNLTVPKEVFSSDDKNQYNGLVTITFSFISDTDYIYLHADDDYIDIKNIRFNNYDLDKSDYNVDSETDILNITVPNPNEISTGRDYALIIDFSSRLSTDDMYGFYKSNYVDQDNSTKYLATTQFESTHARKAFPCFDEPSFKATFDVNITYPTNLKVLFNTPQKSSSSNDTTGLTEAVFEQTQKMSTYLVAFIISEFSCTPGAAVDGVTFQVCSRDEAAAMRKRAAEVGSKVVARMNEFTGYNYNKVMKKLDQVAIPDFSAGAMENWGLVTFREAALLWDENESSNMYNQRVTTVVAHELAHQWFGDLVTCNWWAEIFLNEGFATYFEYHIANEVVSDDWELDKQFLIEQVHTALVADALENAQSLQYDANTPTEINDRFSTISYNKGGSVLRMVSHFLGLDNFKAGLNKYLTDNQLSSTVPEDLWTALESVSDVDLPAETLADVMKNWIKNAGFPLVTATLEDDKIVISQERFLLSSKDTTTKWYVPISYTTSEDADNFNNTSVVDWLTPEEDVTIPYNESLSWVILNNQQTGYYRVNYDDTLWNKIKAALDSETFGGVLDLNRAQIMDDLFNLARAGKVKYSLVLNMAQYLKEETSYYPWYAASAGFDFLLRRVGQNDLGKAISSYVLEHLENLYKSVPFSEVNAEDQIYTHKQVLALALACKLGHEECVKEVSDQFQQYKESEIRPDRNLRSVVYCNALRYSTDKSDWEFLWDAYLNATGLATEQVTILSALGCTKDAELLNEYLTKTITDDSGIRSQDASSAYAAVYSGNPEGIAVAYDFLIKNYEKIAEKYQSMNSLGNIIKGIAERFTTEEEVNKLNDFVSKGNLPDAFLNAAKEALETAKANIQWTKQYESDLKEFYGLSGVGRMGASFAITLMAVFISKLFIY